MKFDMLKGEFESAVKRTIPFVKNLVYDNLLSGVYFDVQNKTANFIGTDVVRLSQVMVPLRKGSSKKSFRAALHAGDLKTILKNLKGVKNDCEISLSFPNEDLPCQGRICAGARICGSVKINTGGYSRWRGVMPKWDAIPYTDATVDRAELLHTLKLVKHIVRENDVPCAIMEIMYGTLSVRGMDEQENRTHGVFQVLGELTPGGKDINTEFNLKFLTQAIQMLKGKKVKIRLPGEPDRPAEFFSGEGGEDFRHILMPYQRQKGNNK